MENNVDHFPVIGAVASLLHDSVHERSMDQLGEFLWIGRTAECVELSMTGNERYSTVFAT